LDSDIKLAGGNAKVADNVPSAYSQNPKFSYSGRNHPADEFLNFHHREDTFFQLPLPIPLAPLVQCQDALSIGQVPLAPFLPGTDRLSLPTQGYILPSRSYNSCYLR